MSFHSVAILAWLIGVLCGVAWVHSFRFRLALAAYVASLAVSYVVGVTSSTWTIDLYICIGIVLLAVGMTIGLVGMIFDGKGNSNANADTRGADGNLPVRPGTKRPDPRQIV